MHLCYQIKSRRPSFRILNLVFWLTGMLLAYCAGASAGESVTVNWSAQTAPEDAISRHAMFSGVHNGMVVMAGGVRTGAEALDAPVYLDSIWLAENDPALPGFLIWKEAAISLPSARAHGASASYNNGTVLIGGSDGSRVFSDTLLVRRNDSSGIDMLVLPSLPVPMENGSAAFVGNVLYVLVANAGTEKESALYALDIDATVSIMSGQGVNGGEKNAPATILQGWQYVGSGPLNAALVSQNDGRQNSLFALEYSNPQGISANFSSLSQYRPSDAQPSWARLDGNSMGLQTSQLGLGSALAIGQSHFLVFTTTGAKTVVMSYNAITGAWAQYDNVNSEPVVMPDQLVPTALSTLPWDGNVLVHQADENGRNGRIWLASITEADGTFGWQNMTVLIAYLFAMVMVGVYFVFKNKNVNDYFRGGQNIPWWANTCSMYATMLSSLTFVGIPAIVYSTDWLYWVGIWMILAVTPVAAYVAMPFFRKIDATSAYEFLSLRFNMPVRLFASGLFTLFHISRMGIVMALTALALAAVTPFDAWQCVLIIGVLSLIYCTLGGIEAVIWTDTIQTVVLLLGALLCFAYIVSGVDGGIAEIFRSGVENNKFRMVDMDFSSDSFTKLALWVVVLGGIGQNLSTYTADQSIVQRYMTTKDVKSARKSIWTNGIMAPVASVLFFAIGTGLYVFYQSNPEKLDPTIQIDQIFPAFISSELPIGIAGLIIAGIFAAAQSTVSTSMNSMSSTLVTDFMRPFNACGSERGYLNAARLLTLIVGILGTLVGLLFISPEIRSLMEEYFKIVGMFMGALGGLFILGIVSTKANAPGAIIGLLVGVGSMLLAWIFELTEGYLFGSIGIATSILVGYFASAFFRNSPTNDLSGLTIHTIK